MFVFRVKRKAQRLIFCLFLALSQIVLFYHSLTTGVGKTYNRLNRTFGSSNGFRCLTFSVCINIEYCVIAHNK